jgi:hypothetical protein
MMSWKGCGRKQPYPVLRYGETEEIHRTPQLVSWLKLNPGLPKYEAVIFGILLLNDLHLYSVMHCCMVNIKGKIKW